MVQQYRRDGQLTYPTAVVESYGLHPTRLSAMYGNPPMGTTYILDSTGRVVYRDVRADPDEMRAALKKLLGK